METASKRKSIFAWLFALLIVSGVFGENRAWAFFESPQLASGVFEAAPPEAIGENYDASRYDAPGYVVAPSRGGGWQRTPKTLQDEMALDAAKKGAGSKIIDNLGDPKFKGMEKWEYKVKSADGKDTVVHYVRDPKTGDLTQNPRLIVFKQVKD